MVDALEDSQCLAVVRSWEERDNGTSWYIKGTHKSTLFKDSSVSLVSHDLSNGRSQILIQINPKKLTLNYTRDMPRDSRSKMFFFINIVNA